MNTDAVEIPPRPPSVPDDAVFDADSWQWRRCGATADGKPDGPLRTWREDGSPLLEGTMVAGKLEGPFRRFSPSRQLAREGRYRDGVIDGIVTCHGPRAPGDEPLRACCVPQGAVRMDARYQGGTLLRETFFDDQGRPLQGDGKPRPPRAAGIPEHADFEEPTQRWYDGSYDDQHSPQGTWRYRRLDATLSEEADYRAGHRVAQRLFDDSGTLFEETEFLFDAGYSSIRHGRRRRRFMPGDVVPYDVPAARWIEGRFDHDESVGVWICRDDQGAVVMQRDLGVALGDRAVDDSLRGPRRPAAEWDALAVRLQTGARVREAILARARACAARGDATGFSAWLASAVLPLPPEAAAAEAARANESKARGVREFLDALVRGGDAPTLLRAVAAAWGGTGDGPLDLTDAAILLAPDRAEGYSLRSLLRIERGIDAGLADDIARLGQHSQDSADYLSDYLRVLRPEFSFWPARESPPPLPEEVVMTVDQDIDRVRRAVQIYATRLLRIRQALLAFRPDAPAWLPPDPGDLLPEGPLVLEDSQADIVDELPPSEGDDPAQAPASETTRVSIGEALSTGDLGVPSLLRMARAQWAALAWICWSVGMDRVALPGRIDSHPDFARALVMAVTRAFRARDALSTRGLVSMTRGIPGFVWEGLDIDRMETSFAEIAADEYLEIRAALLYLSNAGNLSPFQDDLRKP